jgi:hypothetical protein
MVLNVLIHESTRGWSRFARSHPIELALDEPGVTETGPDSAV